MTFDPWKLTDPGAIDLLIQKVYTKPTMINDPKEEWSDFQERLNDRHGTYTVDDLIRDIVTESRSRFKEEVLKALEAEKQKYTLISELRCRDCGLSNTNCECFGYDDAIQEAIETIKKL